MKVSINKILRLAFIAAALIFVYLMFTTPKTHCEACRFEFGSKTLNGNEAYQMFEAACINYSRPGGYVYIDIDELNYTVKDNGIPTISFNENSGQGISP